MKAAIVGSLTAAILLLVTPAHAETIDVTVPVKDNCTLTVAHYEYEDKPIWVTDFYALRYRCD